MKKSYLIIFLNLFLFCQGSTPLFAQVKKPEVLIRLDDCGMNHSVNMAIEEIAKTGIPFSTSVMFACPWYQEAVAMLKKYPHVSVGVHLTLNAEWRNYRWGPIAGKSVVPSLVDSLGYFLPSTALVQKNSRMDEVEIEMSAQIERALHSGLKIDYIDTHMGTIVSTPELRAVFEKLSKKYNLAMSWYFGEEKFKTPGGVTNSMIFEHFNNLQADRINMVVFHIAQATPEMNAIVSLNQPGQRDSVIAGRRSRLRDLLLSKEFKDLIDQKKFQLITYRSLVKKVGLKNMHPGTGKNEDE